MAELRERAIALADRGRVEAAHLITEGSVSGKNHVPSAPHDPPNRDTGQLDTSIVARKTGPVSAEYAATAPYALALEVGTSNEDGTERMIERPFMGPSAKIIKELAPQELARGLRIIIKGS